jgi:hypothetical protein
MGRLLIYDRTKSEVQTMVTPTYEVQRIGDQYVPVLKQPYPATNRSAYVFGGALLCYMGLVRRGWLGILAMGAGATLLTTGATGCCSISTCRAMFSKWSRNGAPSHAPSYQNDGSGRAPQIPMDLVEEQSMESFPASDPPARTGVAI